MLWALTAALAGNVYINNVRVEPSQLAGLELKSVNVRTDAQGNVWIDAPGYTVSPVDANGRPVPPPSTPPVTPPMPTTGVPMPGAVSSEAPSAVKPGEWWLYAEDDGSTGHSVDVLINGVLVSTVRSGAPAPILELSRWLRPGANQVECVAQSIAPTGGPLYVYVGRGQDVQGTVQMGSPEVQFGVGKSRTGETRKSYQIEVSPR